ncbi:hypothetical protein SNEBB_003220 [Seison nebaliae]|nr:hypothetical protein SNEBB_003220 [Seison nebaliae]
MNELNLFNKIDKSPLANSDGVNDKNVTLNSLSSFQWEMEENQMKRAEFNFLSLLSASVLFFYLLHKVIGPSFSSFFSNTYRRMGQRTSTKLTWDTRINSTISAIITSSICIYIFIYEDELPKQPLYFDSFLVQLNLTIVCGYLIVDSIIMIKYYHLMGDLLFLIHHIASIPAFIYVLSYDVMTYFANFRLIAELSTPFVNLRWYLDITKYPRASLLYSLNGLAMTMVFFIVRIAIIPPFWYKVYLAMQLPLWKKMGFFRFIMLGVCATLELINLQWFVKICFGLFKMIRARLMCDMENKQK